MEKRTYEQAVEITVNWWIEKSFKTPLNQNNGDNSENGGIGFMLINLLSMNAQDRNTPEKIEKFKETLTKLLLEAKNKGRYSNQLDVDYHPSELLSKACEQSGIDTGCLPIKTFTFINQENEVEGRYQYGGEWFKI